MQTTVGQKQKRLDHQQGRRLALIIGLVASVAIIAVALVLTRTGEGAEQSSAVLVTTQPPFSDTLDKGMLSPAVAQQERPEVVRREGMQSGSADQQERNEVLRREWMPTAAATESSTLPSDTLDPRPGFPTDGRMIP